MPNTKCKVKYPLETAKHKVYIEVPAGIARHKVQIEVPAGNFQTQSVY